MVGPKSFCFSNILLPENKVYILLNGPWNIDEDEVKISQAKITLDGSATSQCNENVEFQVLHQA